MSVMRAQFGGIVTESHHRFPSGTADRALNVVMENGTLARRQGFALYEDDANGSASAIRGLWTAAFADGDVYLVVKCADGYLWQRKVYDAAGSPLPLTFSQISGGQSHNAADPGWAFMWADRFHYFDRAGGTRWNPDANSGTAYKAGLCRPTTGALVQSATSGQKDGSYRVHMGYRNSRTDERSPVAGPNATVVSTFIKDGNGGIAVQSGASAGMWHAATPATAGIRVQDSSYEWDQAEFFTTMGHTEKFKGQEVASHHAYSDVVADKSSASVPGMNKADSVLDPRYRFGGGGLFTNAGGEPPGAQVGCFVKGTGRGIYGKVWQSGALVADKLMFSIPRFPTMVPQRQSYTVNADISELQPQPFLGEIITGIDGAVTDLKFGGGVPVLFTHNAAWYLRTGGDGRLYPTEALRGKGCAGTGAAVGTPWAVHALGMNCWLQISQGGARDLADGLFYDLLAESPARCWSTARLGYFESQDQVWAAVVPPDAAASQSSKATRILVWDRTQPGGGALTMYEPACLGTRATAVIGAVTFTAVRPGVTGNDITVALAGGAVHGRETVTVTGNAVSATIALNQTTGTELVALLVNHQDVLALLDPAVTGTGSTAIAAAVGATALTGGAEGAGITALCELALPNAEPVMLIATDTGAIYAYGPGVAAAGETALTGTHNDLRFTAVTPGAGGNSITVAYTTGGTAGAEVVTVVGNAISVQVQAATSTATQVKTALDASGAAVALVTTTLAYGNTGAGTIPSATSVTLAGGNGGTLDNTTAFGAHWRGTFGQERLATEQKLGIVGLHTVSGAAHVLLGLRTLRTGGEAVRPNAVWLTRSLQREPVLAELGTLQGRMFQIEFLSRANTSSGAWEIQDLEVALDVVGKR